MQLKTSNPSNNLMFDKVTKSISLCKIGTPTKTFLGGLWKQKMRITSTTQLVACLLLIMLHMQPLIICISLSIRIGVSLISVLFLPLCVFSSCALKHCCLCSDLPSAGLKNWMKQQQPAQVQYNIILYCNCGQWWHDR